MSGQIKWMVEHPEERQRMGLNARKLMEEAYTLELQASRYLKLYASLSKS